MYIIPEKFAQDRLTFGDDHRLWLERLPAILQQCEQRWQLTLFEPFPDLSYHYVAPARLADGTEVAVKAFSPTNEFKPVVEVLDLFAGRGVLRLLAYDATDEVMVLERLRPGKPLSSLVPRDDEQATAVLADIMRRLWCPAPTTHSFPTVAGWMEGFTRLRRWYQGGHGPFRPELLEEAEYLAAQLLATSPQAMVLHGDLHHDNILSTEQGWLAIDPKGLVGDPAYEVSVMLYNPDPGLFQADQPRRLIARRIDQMAEALGMERARIRNWGLVQAVLSVWWGIEDNGHIWQNSFVCAEILASLPAE